MTRVYAKNTKLKNESGVMKYDLLIKHYTKLLLEKQQTYQIYFMYTNELKFDLSIVYIN